MESEFVLETYRHLEEATARSMQEGKNLVAIRTEGCIWIADYLCVSVSDEVINVLNSPALLKNKKHLIRGSTLGEIVESTVSVGRALKRVKNAYTLMRKLDRPEIVDQLADIEYCLVMARSAVNNSRKVSSYGEPKFQEYCVLCWRAVNKYRLKNYQDADGSSSYFCSVHHPKREGAAYQRARRALLAAAERRDTEFDRTMLKKIEKIKSKKQKYMNELSHLTYSFTPSKNIRIPDVLKSSKAEWSAQRDELMRVIEVAFPYTHKILKPACKAVSWSEWFFEVVSQLDAGISNEADRHENDKKRISSDKAVWSEAVGHGEALNEEESELRGSLSHYVGYRVLLAIFARHEAVHEISLLQVRKTVGRKPGQTRINHVLREGVKQAIEYRQRNGLRINFKEIAAELGVSSQTIRNTCDVMKLL